MVSLSLEGSLHSRFHSYANDTAYLRSLAVMALVAMSYDDAAPVLAKHAQRSPGFDNDARCSSDIAAISDFLHHSDPPQARQAIASYARSAAKARSKPSVRDGAIG